MTSEGKTFRGGVLKRFMVNFSVDKNYDVFVVAESMEEANRAITEGRYSEYDIIPAGESFLGVNNVVELEE